MVRIVVPGEKLFEKAVKSPHTYIENEKTYSLILGVFNEEEARIIPLEGAYIPLPEDMVIGVINEIKFVGWDVDIKSPYTGFLSSKDYRYELKLGSVIFAKVKYIDEMKNVGLCDAKELVGGEIIEIVAAKVPRVIGKKTSMLNMIKKATQSDIVVGKNGRIWINGGNSGLAARAILKIESEAHISGLTDVIQKFLEEESK